MPEFYPDRPCVSSILLPLEGYRVLLGQTGVAETRLVLLTRYPQELSSGPGEPDRAIRWYAIADWLESELPACEQAGEVAGFLARQFLKFLGERGMTLTQVGKYMPEGVRALADLMIMLREVANRCAPPTQTWADWEFIGVRLDQRKYWAGIYFSEPQRLYFEMYSRINEEAAEKLGLFLPAFRLTREKSGKNSCWCSWWAVLDSEDNHFFTRSKVHQMEWLEKFLQDNLAMAKSIEIPGQPPIPEEPEEGS